MQHYPKRKQGGFGLLGLMLTLVLYLSLCVFTSNALATGSLTLGAAPDPGRNAAIWKGIMQPMATIAGMVGDIMFIPEPTLMNNAPALAEAMALTPPACACGLGTYSLMDAMMVPVSTMMSGAPIEKIDAQEAWEMAQRGELQLINSLPKGGYDRFHFPGEIEAPLGAELIELMDSGRIPKDKWVSPECV